MTGHDRDIGRPREEGASDQGPAAIAGVITDHVPPPLAAQHLAAAMENIPLGLAVVDTDLRLFLANSRYRTMLRLPAHAVRPGVSLRAVVECADAAGEHPGLAADAILAEQLAIFAAKKAASLLTRFDDGRTLETTYQPMPEGGWIIVCNDVTESERRIAALRHRDAELRTQNLLFDAALDNMSHGITMWDGEERLVVVNRRYYELTGTSPQVVWRGMTYREIASAFVETGYFPEQTAEEVYARGRARIDAGPGVRHLDQLASGVILASRHQLLPGGGWVSVFEDVTDLRRAEARITRITHMALHDAMTGLPNRVLLRQRLEEALAGTRSGRLCAVLCLDLDDFKSVNDTLGHPIGDALLRHVTERLRYGLRESDTVARLGGDEFAIIQTSVEQPDDTRSLAERLVRLISAPYAIAGHQVVVGVSIGIAMPPVDGTDPDVLLKHADIALYKAKANGGRGYCFFDAEMSVRMQARHMLEMDLRHAVTTQAFELHYQPLVEIPTRRPIGFEALLRWRHPSRGLVAPADFIPLAEDTGLILPIGEWVLRQACAEAAGWPDSLKVAVNLSAAQFRAPGLADSVIAILRETCLPPERLELEITETVLLHDSADMLATLHRLRSVGVAIALDDFGTGYSSLATLRRFPFTLVKIDRSFVADIGESGSTGGAILRAVANLCAALGMAATVEGVETEAQLAWLTAEGFVIAQGHLFGQPMPVSELRRRLDARPPRRVRPARAGGTALTARTDRTDVEQHRHDAARTNGAGTSQRTTTPQAVESLRFRTRLPLW
jgi:diguanylate cyclase (GGDEF)-like protein